MSETEAASASSETSDEIASGSASEEDEDSSPEARKRSPAADKKKKKKKKHKKKTEHANANQPAEPSAAEKADADRRIATAVRQLKSNDEDEIWVKLSQCHLHDSKAKQISEALQKNKFLTSLDLSSNRITDGGAEALVAVLSHGAAPELIYLDLRGNPLTEAGTTALAGLMKSRKQLTVETGPSAAELAAQEAESVGTAFEHAEVASESEVVRRFFQGGGGNQPMAREASIPPEVEEDPEAAAVRLWKEVCEALQADPVDMACLSGALRWISMGLTKELGKIREEAVHSFPIAVKAAKAKPFYDSSQQHLRQLSAAIDHRGPPILTTYSRDDAQETGGGHLPGAASVLAQLVPCAQPEVESQAVAERFVAQLLTACLRYPCANALHCATMQLMRACADSACPGLMLPVVEPQTTAHTDNDSEQASVPWHHQLMAIGIASQDTPIGKRPCHLAFVIQLSQLLRQVQEGFSGDHQRVGEALRADKDWMAFVGAHGPLQLLISEQDGVLVGPRPEKPPPLSQGSAGEGGGHVEGNGNVFSEQLLRFLQSIGKGGGSAGF
ncbi:hypothetical protein WJX77_003902 [Trebouxia sp. C0004]